MRPLLSICIPTYNRSQYLKQALETYVSNAAFDDEVEIVISDNASTDNTEKMDYHRGSH
jgi:abequosyltransferase